MDNFEILYRSGMMSKQTINGTPPLTFTSDGSPLSDYTIYGYTSPNLFDASANLVDSGIDRDTGEIVESSGSSVSDWIAYDSSQGLFISAQRTIAAATSIIFAFYDSEKNYIDWVGVVFSSGQHSYEVTEIPDLAAFFRVQFFDDGFSNVMINQGDSALPYEAYGNVGDKTANVLPRPAVESVGTTTKNGVTFTVTETGQVFISGTANSDTNHVVNLSESFVIPKSVEQGGSGTFAMNNSKDTASNVTVVFRYSSTENERWTTTPINRVTNAYRNMGGKTINNYRIIVTRGYTLPLDFSLGLAFSNNEEYVTPFEPYGYKVPIICGDETTNIYMDSPLDDGDSISLSTAGVEIPTIEGENTLTVGTTVQPSAVEIKAVKSAALSKADRYFQYLYDVARSRR